MAAVTHRIPAPPMKLPPNTGSALFSFRDTSCNIQGEFLALCSGITPRLAVCKACILPTGLSSLHFQFSLGFGVILAALRGFCGMVGIYLRWPCGRHTPAVLSLGPQQLKLILNLLGVFRGHSQLQLQLPHQGLLTPVLGDWGPACRVGT